MKLFGKQLWYYSRKGKGTILFSCMVWISRPLECKYTMKWLLYGVSVSFIYFQPVNIYRKKFTKHSFKFWTMMAYLTRDWHFHLEWVIIDCVYAYIILITLLSRGKLFHKIYHQWEMFVCEYFQLGLISIVSFGVWLAGWGIIIFLVTFLLLQILATWNKSCETHWIRQGKIQRW